MESRRKAFPSDVSDEEWAFVAPYLTLLSLDAKQRQYDLREVFGSLRVIVKTGMQWRFLPNDLSPWPVVYQLTQRWMAAGSFEAIVHALRAILRLAMGRGPEPSTAVFDGGTLQSTPASGLSAGYDGHKRRKGSKVHMAMDPLGHLLAMHVTPASEQERHQVEDLARAVQGVMGEHVERA